MSLKDRVSRLEGDGPERCDACLQLDGFAGCGHDPEVCDEAEQAAGFPRLRSLMRAGWFRKDAPKHEHVPMSDATRALLDSGALVVDRDDPKDAALSELARLEPQLWRCKEERRGPAAKEPCPECEFMPDVVEIVHTHAAAVM
jgi:hypothetical protein